MSETIGELIDSLHLRAMPQTTRPRPRTARKKGEGMKITICSTQNGWLIVRGEIIDGTREHLIDRSQSFNSLDKAISAIRKEIKGWHAKPTHPKRRDVDL